MFGLVADVSFLRIEAPWAERPRRRPSATYGNFYPPQMALGDRNCRLNDQGLLFCTGTLFSHAIAATPVRTFMRYFILLALGVGVFCSVAGCPASEVSGPDANANTNVNGVSDPAAVAERLAAIERAEQSISDIDLDGDPGTSDRIAEVLSGSGEFESVAAYHDNVVATFPDGELLIVINNRGQTDLPEGGESADAQLKSGIGRKSAASPDRRAKGASPNPQAQPLDPTRVPASKKAVLINAMGTAYRDSTELFAGWFSASGYQPAVVEGSVEGLRTGVRDVGVLYMSAHGAPIVGAERVLGGTFPDDADFPPPAAEFPASDGKDHFALWTTTMITDATIPQYADEVRAGKLAYGLASVNLKPGGGSTRERHFMITEKFVREHWRCRPGALLYIDACSSASTRMANVCLGSTVGAAAYLGWTHDVFDIYSTPTVRYFFDRTLGVNQYEPVLSPPQRPFSTNHAIAAMSGLTRLDLPLDVSKVPKSIFRDPGSATPEDPSLARLVALYAKGVNDVLLRPGIQTLSVGERNDGPSVLMISGHFGADQGTVTVGGVDAPVRSGGWAENRIECDVPRGGAGASGPVVVRTLERDSNPRQLTQWNMTFRVTFMDFPALASLNCPACFYEATLNYQFRADVAGVRLELEGDVAPSTYTGGPSDADLEVTNAGGSYTQQQDIRYNVALTPNIGNEPTAAGTCVGYFPPNDNYVGACYFVNVPAGVVEFSPTYQALGLVQNFSGGGAFDGAYPYAVVYSGNLRDNVLLLSLSPNFNISAGQQPFAFGPNSYFEWDAAAAENPPGASDPR